MLVLAHDWVGPEGIWPNGQNLDFYSNPRSYEKSYYSISNIHPYNLESYRHLFTYSKLESVIGNVFTRKHISECKGKFIYEITPLLKPYQWADRAFDNVSKLAITKQQQGMCLFVINDMNEGYSNVEYNFFDALHRQIERYNLLPENVLYITMNAVLEQFYKEWCLSNNINKQIRIHSVFIFENKYNTGSITNCSKHYICLNRQPNPYRQCLVYELWCRGLLKYGYVSMPDPSIPLDVSFNKENLKLFNLDDSRWDEFISTLPYEVDGRDFTSQSCDLNSISDFYKDSVYAIISENTYGEQDCIKFSEKTFNAFDNYCIPLYFYNAGIAKELNKIGYVADDSIDSVSNLQEKFYAFVNRVEDICKIPIVQLNKNTSSTRSKNFKNLQLRSKDRKDRYLEMFNGWEEY